jgi:DNA-binding XRE family transcriptional regulator
MRRLLARGEAVAEPPVTFAGLLRKLRTEAWLTQEELAEAAGCARGRSVILNEAPI